MQYNGVGLKRTVATAVAVLAATAAIAATGCVSDTIELFPAETDGDGPGNVDVGDDDDVDPDGDADDADDADDDADDGDPGPPPPPVPPPMTCGNGVRDGDEACDGTDWGPEGRPSCEELLGPGFAGFVSCTECQADGTACGMCGDGIVQPGAEQCEPGDPPIACDELLGDGALGNAPCGSACAWDVGACGEASGAAVITELMIIALVDPKLFDGEWFEIHNPAPDVELPLQGCVISGASGVENFAIDEPLTLPPGGYATFGRGSMTNLGFAPDVFVPNNFTLLNGGDIVRLSCDGVEYDTFNYQGLTAELAVEPGIAIATAPGATAASNDFPGTWCHATTEYAPERFGTPGAPNDC